MPIELRAPKGRPFLLGHRGASGYAPENTMPSFQKALNMDVDLVELDVRLTKDGRVVVCHDDSLERTTGFVGLVTESTWEEIGHLDAGTWFSLEYAGARIPPLEEVLRWARGRVPLVVEIKRRRGESGETVDNIVELVRSYGMKEEVEIISFDHCFLKRVKEVEPTIATGIIYAAPLVNPVATARALLADALHPQYSCVNREMIQEAHRAGLAVSTWVVNDPRRALILASWGVDCIGTDYPDRIIRALKGNP